MRSSIQLQLVQASVDRSTSLLTQIATVRAEVAAKSSTIASLREQHATLHAAAAIASEAGRLRRRAAAAEVERVWGSAKTASCAECNAALLAAGLSASSLRTAAVSAKRAERRQYVANASATAEDGSRDVVEFVVTKVHKLRGKMKRRFVLSSDTFATYDAQRVTNMWRFERNFCSAAVKADDDKCTLLLEIEHGAMRSVDALGFGRVKKAKKVAKRASLAAKRASAAPGGLAAAAAAAAASSTAATTKRSRVKPRVRTTLAFELASAKKCAELVAELLRRSKVHGKLKAEAVWHDDRIEGVEIGDHVAHSWRGRGVVVDISPEGDLRVHVQFGDSGEVHRYKEGSWKSKIRFVD